MLILDPKPNIELIDAVELEIRDNPENWSQDWWNAGSPDANLCSTTFCFAGHAALLSGAERPRFSDFLWEVDPDTGKSVNRPHSRTAVHVAEYAAEKLGLTDAERKELFHASTDLLYVGRILRGIRNRAAAIEAYEAHQEQQALDLAAQAMADIAFLDAEASQEELTHA